MKSRNKAILWVVSVFLIGALFGGTASYFFVKPIVSGTAGRRPDQSLRRPPSPEQVLKRFAERLNLDSQQQAQVRVILENSRKRYHAANQESRKLFHGVRQSTLEEIRAVLRPEQVPKLENFIREEDERWQERRRNRDGH